MTPSPADALVRELCARVGLSSVHVGPVGPTPTGARFEEWLSDGLHADMSWMERNPEVRADPRIRLPGARSALVLTVLHHHQRPPDPGGRTGLVARYAWGRDYHNLVGKRLRKLRRALAEAGVNSWGGCDTAPILERAWASASGAGFLGKNCMIFAPGQGSWRFLAVLFVDVALTPDRPLASDHCGSCSRCLVACPTDAFRGPRSLDARRCISYWTIEAEGLAPPELRPAFGRWVFGCDLCQEVCPHNHDPAPSPEDDLAPRHAWLDLDEVLNTDDDALMDRFVGTPLRRPGAAGLKRNACVALGNLGDPGGLTVLHDRGLTHPSPVVREAAAWAVARLGRGPAPGRRELPRNAPPRDG